MVVADIGPATVNAEPPVLPTESADGSGSCESDSSASSASEEARESEAEGEWRYRLMDSCAQVQRFKQPHARVVRLAREVDAEGKFTPMCRSEPFRVGVEEGMDPSSQCLPVHDRSLLKLPPEVRRDVVARQNDEHSDSDLS